MEQKSDATPPVVPIPEYKKINYSSYQVGVSKLTSFGLDSKLYYDWRRTQYIDPSYPPGIVFPPNYYYARPTVELTQPVWGNGFGRTTRAKVERTDARAVAAHFESRDDARKQLADTDAAYWRLVFFRDVVALQRESLAGAKRLDDYVVRQARLHLADQAEATQAEAALRLHELDLQQALDDEREAARMFNTARGVDSEDVPETLMHPDWDRLSYPAAEPTPSRDDVQAARERVREKAGDAAISIESNRPSLDLYALFALNALQQSTEDTWARSFNGDHPTESVGLRFAMPLNYSALKKTREGYATEAKAAEEAYQRKLFELKRDWNNLTRSINEARTRLELNRQIEKAQKAKVDAEVQRLRHGRTTTYQVILFEQDYASAVISRIRAEARVMGLLAGASRYGNFQ